MTVCSRKRELLVVAMLLAACDDRDREPVRPSSLPVPPISPSIVAALDEDAAAIAAPVDPLGAPGDLKDEVVRFKSLDLCVKERSNMDPLLSDALLSFGYDSFIRDACRMLGAVKSMNARECAAIDTSALRSRCQSMVAMTVGRPDDCPSEAASPRYGRDATCVAVAMRDPRMCQGESTERVISCEALATHDPKRCVRSLFARERCERDAARWSRMFELGAPAPALASHGEFSIKEEGAAPRIASLSHEVDRGLVLVEEGTTRHVRVGELSESGLVPHLSDSIASRVGFEIDFPKLGTPHVARLELELPGRTVANIRGSDITLSMKKPGTTRSAPIAFTIDGTLPTSTKPIHLHIDVETFVRDVTRAR